MSDEPTFHKAAMVAMTFAAQCPLCDMATEIDWVEDDDAGVWYPRADCQFIKCRECGADLDVQGVTMEPADQPPFRNKGG